MTTYAADLAAIRRARARICAHAHVTPVVTSRALDEMAGRALFFKCEMFQRGGAFKFRGACNAVFALSEEIAERGVVTHSSGNHAQALALAAKLRGIAAHVVMPATAREVKRRATEEYGARVYTCEPTLEAREQTARSVAQRTGAIAVPPYDHPDVIAGQGTIFLELAEQVSELDAVVAPIGGGGLISGLALAARELAPGVRIFGAEPTGADDAARSKAAGVLIPQTGPRTIADGLLTSLGELTWPVVRDRVHRVLTVSDAAIVSAMRLVWERMKLVVEPSGAVALAAVLEHAPELEGSKRVAVVLSGGNIAFDDAQLAL
jgi:threonine dehydratase/serine racemase